MAVGSKDMIFLLGAGASSDAGIPVSGQMVTLVEKLLQEDGDWKEFLDLYHHVKSSFHFACGLRGVFQNVPFHIEALVNTLYELERNEEHPLYPFIASWNARFVALAGQKFEHVKKFRRRILSQLKDWMCPDRPSDAGYLTGIVPLQKDLGHPLRIFTLNYDLLIEGLGTTDFVVETGFAGFDPEHTWEFERFGDNRQANPQVFLYKLHGSIDWKRNPQTKHVRRVKQIQQVEPDKMDLIFGRDFKLEAADPYLFFAYEFRRLALEAKLIVSLGYGFGDDHINKMLTQSLRGDKGRRLLVVLRCSANELQSKQDEVAKRLDLDHDQSQQIVVLSGSAREFLEQKDLLATLVRHTPTPADAPF